MQRFLRNWPTGKKLIIQTGWAGLSPQEEREDILFVGKVSHDQLFSHGSVIIHHASEQPLQLFTQEYRKL